MSRWRDALDKPAVSERNQDSIDYYVCHNNHVAVIMTT